MILGARPEKSAPKNRPRHRLTHSKEARLQKRFPCAFLLRKQCPAPDGRPHTLALRIKAPAKTKRLRTAGFIKPYEETNDHDY